MASGVIDFISHDRRSSAILKASENMLHEEIPSLFMAFPSAAIVELLLKAGADPNKPRWQREDRGWERLHPG